MKAADYHCALADTDHKLLYGILLPLCGLEWLEAHEDDYTKKDIAKLGIEIRKDSKLIGRVSLRDEKRKRKIRYIAGGIG